MKTKLFGILLGAAVVVVVVAKTDILTKTIDLLWSQQNSRTPNASR